MKEKDGYPCDTCDKREICGYTESKYCCLLCNYYNCEGVCDECKNEKT